MLGEKIVEAIRFKRKNLYLFLILFKYIAISGLLLFISNNVIFDIIALVILVFGAMSIVRFDLAHPYVWFSFVFMLYSVSYPIFYFLGMTSDVYTYTKSLMFSQWLALVVFLIVVTPKKVDYSRLREIKIKIVSNRLLLIVASLILFVTILYISTGGYSNKGDIYNSGSIIVTIGFRAVFIFLMLYTIKLTTYGLENNKLDLKLTYYVFCFMFLLVFFSGERDLLIRFFVILSFVYYIIVKNSKMSKEVVLLFLVSLSIIPILAKYKYFGLTGESTESDLNFLLSLLNSEFQSASKNLQIILLDESTNGMFNGFTFLSSFLRAFDLDKLLNIYVISSGGWYNDTYFAAGRAGQGFTLVGDGYVNFGYIGIIILFIFISLIVRVIYLNSNKGVYFFTFYILSIPVYMYSLRADLANILSQLIQQNVVGLLSIYLVLKILYSMSGKVNDSKVKT